MGCCNLVCVCIVLGRWRRGSGIHPFPPSQAHFLFSKHVPPEQLNPPRRSLALLGAQVINSIQTQAAGFEETFLCMLTQNARPVMRLFAPSNERRRE